MKPKDDDEWALRAQIIDSEPKLGVNDEHVNVHEVPKEVLKALIPNTIVEFVVDRVLRGKHSRID